MFLYHLLNFIIFWVLFFIQRFAYGYILDSLELSFKNDKSIYIPLLSFIVCFIICIRFFNYYSLKLAVKDEIKEIEKEEKEYKDPTDRNSFFYKIKKVLKWILIIIIALGGILILFAKSNLNEIKDLNKSYKELATQKNTNKPNIDFNTVKWKFVKKTEDNISMFFDENSINNFDNRLTYWALIDFGIKEEDGTKSILSFTEVNCKTDRLDSRSLKDFHFSKSMGKGEILKTFNEPSEWVFYPFEDSEGFKYFKKMCEK